MMRKAKAKSTKSKKNFNENKSVGPYEDSFQIQNTTKNLLRAQNDFKNEIGGWGRSDVEVNPTTHTIAGDHFDVSLMLRQGYGISNIGQSVSTVGGRHRVIIYAKSCSHDFLTVQIGLDDNIKASFFSFNLVDGTCGSEQCLVGSIGAKTSCSSYSGGWYKCIVEFVAGSSRTDILFGVANKLDSRNGEPNGSIYICNASLVEIDSNVRAEHPFTGNPPTS